MRKPSFSNFPLSKLSFIDRLPRQARDKHTESSKHDFPSHTAAVAPSVGTLVLSRNQRLLGNALVQEDDLDKHINTQGLSPGCEICIF